MFFDISKNSDSSSKIEKDTLGEISLQSFHLEDNSDSASGNSRSFLLQSADQSGSAYLPPLELEVCDTSDEPIPQKKDSSTERMNLDRRLSESTLAAARRLGSVGTLRHELLKSFGKVATQSDWLRTEGGSAAFDAASKAARRIQGN